MMLNLNNFYYVTSLHLVLKQSPGVVSSEAIMATNPKTVSIPNKTTTGVNQSRLSSNIRGWRLRASCSAPQRTTSGRFQ
jgi:hypothetical protein